MGLFDSRHRNDINGGLEEYRAVPGAVLLDVRTPEEYKGGRIPGSINIPLQAIELVAAAVPDRSTPLFVYCQSGIRSRQAAAILQRAGYTQVHNIGAFAAYQGAPER